MTNHDVGGTVIVDHETGGKRPGDDRAALERSLESCRTYLLYVAWRLKGSDGVAGAEGASDLVQQTMLVALKKVREGKGPGPTPRDHQAWLARILRNVMHEKTRRSLKQPAGLDGPVADSGTSPSGVLDKREQAQAIEAALGRLDPAEREVVVWRCLDGLSYEEIGRRRGYSDTYARRVVKGLLGRLRTSIAE